MASRRLSSSLLRLASLKSSRPARLSLRLASATATPVPPIAYQDWLPDPPVVPVEHEEVPEETARPVHAVVSTFDLLSIGIGPSSSHSVGPMRAGKIFVESLRDLRVLSSVAKIKIALYGSLAATGKGHLTPQALLLGLEGYEPETVDPDIIVPRYNAINNGKSLVLAGEKQVQFDIRKDLMWYFDQVLPQHSNGLILSVFDGEGDLLATNKYYSVGGGFVVHDEAVLGNENLYYREIHRDDAQPARRQQGQPSQTALPGKKEKRNAKSAEPPFPFTSADSLLALTRKHNMTIAQIVYENEKAFVADEREVRLKTLRLWQVMDECIRQSVTSTEEYLPGPLRVKRKARQLHNRLLRGLYPHQSMTNVPSSSLLPGNGEAEESDIMTGVRTSLAIRGQLNHALRPIAPRRPVFPAMDLLSTYAIAVNEVNAAGGRVVTAPTNGAAGVIPAVLKYSLDFISDDVERDVLTFLLTAAAIGMLYKRGATISAAEGGCMAEVGVATSMAAAGFTAIMGGRPEQIERAAEIAIEHSLGLTCDPIAGLVQVPCIERNALGAVKAVSAANLALASTDGSHAVSLDQAIAAMRQTAKDMSSSYKETSRSGLATAVKGRAGAHAKVSVSVPEC